MFWLGLGAGLVITSLLLGLTGGADPIDDPADGLFTLEEEQLREVATEHGYRLISNATWDELNEQAQLADELLNEKQANEEQAQPTVNTDANTIYLYVPQGFSWQETGQVLEQAKFVKSSEDVMQAMRELGKQKHLQSGLYKIAAEESARDIVNKMSQSPE